MAEAEVGDDVYGEDPTVNRLRGPGRGGARHGGRPLRALGHDGQRDRDPHPDRAGRRGARRAPEPRRALRAVRDERAVRASCRAWCDAPGGHLDARARAGGGAPRGLLQVRREPRGAREHPQPRRRHGAAGRGVPGGGRGRAASAASACTSTGPGSGTRRWRSACRRPRSWRGPTRSWPACRRACARRSGRSLASSRERIERARRARKLLGGGHAPGRRPRRRPGLVALDALVPRLAEDHAHARLLGEALARGRGVQRARRSRPTSWWRRSRAEPRPTSWPPCASEGVLAIAMDARTLRLVTHRDVSREDCERAAAAIERALG